MPVETRLQLVLAVLAHEMTAAEAARRNGVSAESINRWRNRFVDAGKAAMEDGMPGKAGSRGNQVERRQRAETLGHLDHFDHVDDHLSDIAAAVAVAHPYVRPRSRAFGSHQTPTVFLAAPRHPGLRPRSMARCTHRHRPPEPRKAPASQADHHAVGGWRWSNPGMASRWTDEESAVLVQAAGLLFLRELEERLPGRTATAIRLRTRKLAVGFRHARAENSGGLLACGPRRSSHYPDVRAGPRGPRGG